MTKVYKDGKVEKIYRLLGESERVGIDIFQLTWGELYEKMPDIDAL